VALCRTSRLTLTSALVALIFITSAVPCCAASQKAYWDIKQKFMDTILFYKIGKV
jgi:Fe2+ transport system protein B